MRIAVYCSARRSIDPAYADDARRLGQWIGRNGHTLVYGGLEYGLMDEVARAAAEAGAKVVGVVPQSRLRDQHPANTLSIGVSTLHERKQTMEENADVFVALEGGLGTIDEIISALVSMTFFRSFQPIMMLNRDGIYTPLRQLFDTLAEHRLAGPPATEAVSFLPDIEALTAALQAEAERLAANNDTLENS